MLTRFCNGCTDRGGREGLVEVHRGGGANRYEGRAGGGARVGGAGRLKIVRESHDGGTQMSDVQRV